MSGLKVKYVKKITSFIQKNKPETFDEYILSSWFSIFAWGNECDTCYQTPFHNTVKKMFQGSLPQTSSRSQNFGWFMFST